MPIGRLAGIRGCMTPKMRDKALREKLKGQGYAWTQQVCAHAKVCSGKAKNLDEALKMCPKKPRKHKFKE